MILTVIMLMRAKCSTNLFLNQKHNGKLEMMATDPNA